MGTVVRKASFISINPFHLQPRTRYAFPVENTSVVRDRFTSIPRLREKIGHLEGTYVKGVPDSVDSKHLTQLQSALHTSTCPFRTFSVTCSLGSTWFKVTVWNRSRLRSLQGLSQHRALGHPTAVHPRSEELRRGHDERL